MKIEFQDPMPSDEVFLEAPDNSFYWDLWDSIKNRRIKLKWGWFRPSSRLYILEPVIEKVLGPRPIP